MTLGIVSNNLYILSYDWVFQPEKKFSSQQALEFFSQILKLVLPMYKLALRGIKKYV